MASSLCFTPLSSFKPLSKPGAVTCTHAGRKIDWISDITRGSRVQTIRALEVKATTDNNKNTKTNSIVCAECEGNGAILCSQCKGAGVNSVDHFNGQFKAGQLCWLCRGKKEILCGNCNGAGFVGGFMSTFDD